MQRDLVDGVPVFWTAGSAPLSAGLVVGVGRRDETFARGGLTHLVEHLTMSALGRTTLECNATVDLTTTEFVASGRPERVVEFLRRVCEALSDLPLDRLAVEADVLRTEDGVVAAPAVGALLAERYGARGVGLAGFREPALRALSAQDVRDWAATWFVRGNAALWLNGEPPAGLSLPLPDGTPPARRPQQVRPMTVPALVEHPVDGAVALGGEVDRLPGVGATARILRDRVEDDLRHRRGLSYTVDTDQVLVEARRRFVVLTADCRDGQEAVAARALWQGLVRLAEEGANEQELVHDRESLQEYLADPRSDADEVHAAAVAEVTGIEHRSSEELRRESDALTAEQVRAAAAAVRDAALLGVPVGVEVSLPALARVPEWSGEVVEGEAFARRRRGSDAPRGARLVVGRDGVSAVLGAGEQVTVRYDDAVALLQVGPAEWSLVGADGTSVPLAPSDWRDGDRAVSLVRERVAAELQVPVDSTVDAARRVTLLHAAPRAAFEALWPSKADAWVAQGDRWTVVVREGDEQEAYAAAAGMSAVTGRGSAVLLLEQAYDELSIVLLHRGKERDRHLWTGEPHDPSVLASALHIDAAALAPVLGGGGPPDRVLAELTRVLDLPPQVAALLAGADPAAVEGMTHERARGVRESIAAAARGEYDPPDSRRLSHRISRWERERPAPYRVANGAAAAVQAALAGVAASRADGDWTSWPGALTVLLGLSAAGSLWSTRPPRKR